MHLRFMLELSRTTSVRTPRTDLPFVVRPEQPFIARAARFDTTEDIEWAASIPRTA